MMTYYGRVVRWSLALTSVVAAVAVVICAVMGGAKGTYGSLIGVGVVAVFFGISILAVSRAAKISPMAMMVGHSTAFNGRMLGFTALACILAWSFSQVGTAMKLQFPYVEPDGKS
jgi:ATP synthase protein I